MCLDDGEIEVSQQYETDENNETDLQPCCNHALKKLSVSQAGKEIGYLVLDNQVYYPYTPEGKSLPKAFFNKVHAEDYLKAFLSGNA